MKPTSKNAAFPNFLKKENYGTRLIGYIRL